MESFAVVPLSQTAICLQQPQRGTSGAYPFRPWKQRTSQPTSFQCHKMYVPGRYSDLEKHRLREKQPGTSTTFSHTLLLESSRPSCRVTSTEQSYNPEAYKELMEFLDEHSPNDGDKFCADLMRESSRHKNLALRIMEVRSAYCKNDFEWDNLKRLSQKMVNDHNTRLMRDYLEETTSHVESEK